jgi:hypothetical protein
MPKDQKPDQERSPEEASALALNVMKRMLATAPKPHVEAKSREKAKSSSRKPKRVKPR